MEKQKLENFLKSCGNKQVVVYVEGDLYYPIKELIETKDYIILKCRDVRKVEGE